MKKKIRVAVLFGGKSAEHEVSIQSAKNVVSAIDKTRFDVVLIGIDKQGKWYLNDTAKFLLGIQNKVLIKLNKSNIELAFVPGEESRQLISISKEEVIDKIDIVFPVLHGPFGEDGTVQGLLKLADIPFVGAGVLGSAIGMDKDVSKRLLYQADIPTANFLTYHISERKEISYKKIKAQLGIPCFIKPANLGSSVGIEKVRNQDELNRAVGIAFQYDTKILIEEYIDAREIECAVLGNENPVASVPGEIIPQHEFYSYQAKYVDEEGAILEVPAKIDENIKRIIQQMAIKAFKVLCCQGMARVDFFLSKDNKIYLNEINTIPGFTRISMYPKLWEASGISYTQLITKLIEYAFERYHAEKKVKTSYT
jgi:D-alanine-D-alanine ligase